MTRARCVASMAMLLLCAGIEGSQTPVQFEARADLILIDATVLDRDGSPIVDLTRDDIQISVDGQPRPIASIQFVKSDAPPATAAPRATHYSSNEGVADGRRIMIVVDENSLPPAAGHSVLQSISRFLAALSAADRVAFIRLPGFEAAVDFTPDRQRLMDAVKKVTGRSRRTGFNRVSLSEAVAFERRDTFQWERALTRICGRLSGEELALCRQEAEGNANEKAAAYQQRARETVRGLEQIVTNLRHMPGPKTLVLLSQGFLSYDLRLEISRVADLAAEARVSLYGLYLDSRGADIDLAEPSATPHDDERYLAEGVDDLTGASRGSRFRVIGTGEGVFARVTRELSGYYLMGVEPVDSDRDGKPHRITVDVKRRDVIVRARRQFAMAASSTAAAESAAAGPGAQLVELLKAATIDAGLPLRVAAFAVPTATPDRVKLIVGADVGTPTASPVEAHIGFVVIDRDSKVVADQFMSVTLRPDVPGEPSLPRYVGQVDVPPGDYTLRLAAVGPEGRSGSVHHPVAAKLQEVDGVTTSDLILAASGRSSVRPEVHVNLDREVLQAVVELASPDAARLKATTVTFEIADRNGGGALVSERGTLPAGDSSVAPVAAALHVGVLPPGEYVARAVISVPGQKPITTARPFAIAPRRRALRPAESESSGAATPAPARGRARPPIPPFKPADVLAPKVVGPFIDHVLAAYSPSPAAREALQAIKAGEVKKAGKGDGRADEVGLAFAQGLALLAENRTGEASAYFRAALRSASDFIGAAFYLGATLAASGKDSEAVGAWQTALIGNVGNAGIYPVLIDGLLRLGDGDQALEILEEANPTFTDRSEYIRRLSQTYALLGRYAEALPLAHEYLATRADDLDMLFLTMHMIYESHAGGEPADGAAELKRFREYASRYAAGKGPQQGIVQGWRTALAIR